MENSSEKACPALRVVPTIGKIPPKSSNDWKISDKNFQPLEKSSKKLPTIGNDIMSAMFIYSTASNRAEAEKIGQVLVEERLAACVNVIDGMHSIYRWQGEIHQDDEAVLIAKTTESNVQALIDRIKALHSYDCPAVVALPIVAGNADYLAWIEKETGDQP